MASVLQVIVKESIQQSIMEDLDEVQEAGMKRMKKNRKRFEELLDLLEEKEVAERQRIHIFKSRQVHPRLL